MRGEIPLDSVYGERLALVRPRRDDTVALSTAYLAAFAAGAKRVVERKFDLASSLGERREAPTAIE